MWPPINSFTSPIQEVLLSVLEVDADSMLLADARQFVGSDGNSYRIRSTVAEFRD